MSGTNKLSIIIPCFNEEKNISIVLEMFSNIVNNSQHNIEVIIVDGGSVDNTPQELKQAFKSLDDKKFKLILRDKRRGYGDDITYALRQATGDVLAWSHADLQTKPDDLIKAYELYLNSSDKFDRVFIKGQRKQRRFIEAFFSLGMQLVVWFALKVYLTDINAQPKLFSRKFYNESLKENYPSDFSLDLYALYQARKKNYVIKTIPVFFGKRIYGQAKGGGGGLRARLKLIRRTFAYIYKLRNDFNFL